MKLARFGIATLTLSVTALAACSGSSTHSSATDTLGGTSAVAGGTKSQGGGIASPATGGSAAGGDSSAATGGEWSSDHSSASSSQGGSLATGGAATTGGKSAATGGSATGGHSSSAPGGKTSQGGSLATGGAATTGGKSAATGGSATGGRSSSATGGKSSQGGSLATGGAATTAGTTAVGGAATVAADCRKEGDDKTTLVFVNGCTQTVTYRGSDIAGGTLAPGAFACVDVGDATAAISSKRYWGYTGSDPGAEHYSLAEFTFNTDFYDLDWYDISYVDAFNLPMAILPSARPKCRQLICPQDFLASCPAVGQDRDGSGQVVSCVSPNRDDASGPVVQLFEQCDDAYAWSGDDQNGTDPSPMIGCQVEDFDIVFCPEAP